MGKKKDRPFQRLSLSLEIRPAYFKDWIRFQKHHYLDSSVSKSCHFYLGNIDGQAVAFSAVIHGCGRDIKSYWRESRIVVLPEWQGMGIGSKFSNSIAEIYTNQGKRFFSKTAHPALGEYRNKNKHLWRATTTNMIKRTSYLLTDGTARQANCFGKSDEAIIRDSNRVCYSHEYIGKKP